MNYCLLPLNLYGSSNFVLYVLFGLKCMLDISMYVCNFHVVAMPSLLVVEDDTNWYQSHGYKTEPEWVG
jgi:hypothetical protein